MFNITITHDSPAPPYEQLRMGIIAHVRSGELTAGTKIPTVRALAAELGLAPNTVARAYRELRGRRCRRNPGQARLVHRLLR